MAELDDQKVKNIVTALFQKATGDEGATLESAAEATGQRIAKNATDKANATRVSKDPISDNADSTRRVASKASSAVLTTLGKNLAKNVRTFSETSDPMIKRMQADTIAMLIDMVPNAKISEAEVAEILEAHLDM